MTIILSTKLCNTIPDIANPHIPRDIANINPPGSRLFFFLDEEACQCRKPNPAKNKYTVIRPINHTIPNSIKICKN